MQKPVIAAALMTLTTFTAVQEVRRPVALDRSNMILEWHPGKEAIVRITSECKSGLSGLRVLHPDGRKLVDMDARGRAQSGLASMEIELSEPDLEQLLAKYAEGRYDIIASTSSRMPAYGHANLSCVLPAPTRIVRPAPGQHVKASHLTVAWRAERDVVAYEIQIEQGDDDDGSEQDDDDGLRVKLPPERSSFEVPDGFLVKGAKTTLEVIAIGANGNRTVTEVLFMTNP